MCCRYSLLSEHARDLLAKAGVADEEGDTAYPKDKYNIAAGTKIPVIRNAPRKSPRKRNHALLHWDFRPMAYPGSAPIFNARAETLWQKTTFADAARTRRCLIPATAFYEWERTDAQPLPWLFQMRDERPFYMAAIWEHGDAHRHEGCCAIVTTAPNALMRPIHDRMPVIIAPEDIDLWLSPDIPDSFALQSLLIPFDPAQMTARRVSTYVNYPRNDTPACFAAPLPHEQTPRQGLLF